MAAGRSRGALGGLAGWVVDVGEARGGCGRRGGDGAIETAIAGQSLHRRHQDSKACNKGALSIPHGHNTLLLARSTCDLLRA